MKKEKGAGELRPPIVTILGHVDHGKTTLLDKIRKTNLASREAGGITQSIGATSVVTNQGKRITFIDTPGHSAFSKMRSRGAKVADLAVLVVAADDGVKPQTKESLSYIKEEKIPFIVAANKMDLPASDIKKVKTQLEKEKVAFEGSGGDTPLVAVSAKTGKGLDELMEMITLVSEVNEVKGDTKGKLEAVIIETTKDKRGLFAAVVVRNGTLKARDEISSEGIECRIKGLFDNQGKKIMEIKPGEAGLILGFSKLPPVGAKVISKEEDTSERHKDVPKKVSRKVGEGEIPVVIKAESMGSLEAIISNLPDKVVVIGSGVGDVSDSDVFLAKSAENSHIFVFRAKTSSSVSKLVDTEGVKIEVFDVIYEFLDRLEELLKKGEEKVLGKAEILAEFPYSNKRVAGCRIVEGRIAKGDAVLLNRREKEVGKAKVVSLRKEKKDVSVVKKDEEFGIILSPQLDFKVGDVILSVSK
ncbi:GTP-binding protein [Patescibacteria group bacterium]|nr:GTP-binding protein [Patescibacteria group bacterium]